MIILMKVLTRWPTDLFAPFLAAHRVRSSVICERVGRTSFTMLSFSKLLFCLAVLHLQKIFPFACGHFQQSSDASLPIGNAMLQPCHCGFICIHTSERGAHVHASSQRGRTSHPRIPECHKPSRAALNDLVARSADVPERASTELRPHRHLVLSFRPRAANSARLEILMTL